MQTIINTNHPDMATCPHCGNYNAMLGTGEWLGETHDMEGRGNEIHQCRDCGTRCFVTVLIPQRSEQGADSGKRNCSRCEMQFRNEHLNIFDRCERCQGFVEGAESNNTNITDPYKFGGKINSRTVTLKTEDYEKMLQSIIDSNAREILAQQNANKHAELLTFVQSLRYLCQGDHPQDYKAEVERIMRDAQSLAPEPDSIRGYNSLVRAMKADAQAASRRDTNDRDLCSTCDVELLEDGSCITQDCNRKSDEVFTIMFNEWYSEKTEINGRRDEETVELTHNAVLVVETDGSSRATLQYDVERSNGITESVQEFDVRFVDAKEIVFDDADDVSELIADGFGTIAHEAGYTIAHHWSIERRREVTESNGK